MVVLRLPAGPETVPDEPDVQCLTGENTLTLLKWGGAGVACTFLYTMNPVIP